MLSYPRRQRRPFPLTDTSTVLQERRKNEKRKTMVLVISCCYSRIHLDVSIVEAIVVLNKTYLNQEKKLLQNLQKKNKKKSFFCIIHGAGAFHQRHLVFSTDN